MNIQSLWTFGCEYTEDYIDAPNQIICVSENMGKGVLIDVDAFHEGFTEDEIIGPCPRCHNAEEQSQ